MRIGLLEEDEYTADLLRGWLAAAGHDVVVHDSAQPFLREAGLDPGDVLIVGACERGAGLDGTQVTQHVREQLMVRVPIMRLCTTSGELDIVAALKAGADDCMVKPLRRLEFLARLEALARRMSRAPKPLKILSFGDLSVDLQNRMIVRKGQRVPLTPKSYDLAVFLFSNLGQLLSRAYLMERIWGRGSGSTRTLDTHISRLRSDLGLTSENGWVLQSVYQHGYRLEQVDMAPHVRAHAGSEAQLIR